MFSFPVHILVFASKDTRPLTHEKILSRLIHETLEFKDESFLFNNRLLQLVFG